MDHLPLSRLPATPRQCVRYACTRPYDGGDFVSYPSRVGWGHVLEPDFVDKIKKSVRNESLEAFFQTWLFFGLLHEILGPEAYREEDYVRIHNSERQVYTIGLISRLEAWVHKVTDLDQDARIALFRHILDCLRLCHSPTLLLMYQHRPGFDRGIRQSIAALAETVAGVAGAALDPSYELARPAGWHHYYLDPKVEQTMERHGWCTNDIASAIEGLPSLSALHFLASLEAPNVGRDHSRCCRQECRTLQIDRNSYRPKHVAGCQCEAVGLTLDKIEESLRGEGSFSLLDILGENPHGVSIGVVPYQDHLTPFVAISHVWADGLGGIDAMELPACQLLRLRRLVSEIPNAQNGPKNRHFFFWCDTICVPPSGGMLSIQDSVQRKRHEELRNISMAKMRTVYEKAAYVLVLDNTLLPYTLSDIGITEATMRLIASPWMRRLWTYHEVALAGRPLIQFKDRAIDLREMWAEMKRLGNLELPYHSIAIQLDFWMTMLRRPYYIRHPEFESGKECDLATMALSLHRRHVSFSNDEALCVATLFNLDVSKVLDAPAGREMKALWGLMPDAPAGIPQGLIFNRSGRLESPGFRWAPASLLRADSTLQLKSPKAQLRPSGLCVKYPAWSIQAKEAPAGIPTDLFDFKMFDLKAGWPDFMMLRDHSGEWWRLVNARESGSQAFTDSPSNLWGLLSTRNDGLVVLIGANPNAAEIEFKFPSPEVHPGLIASMETGTEERPLLRSLAVIDVARMPDPEQKLWTAAFEEAAALRQGDQVSQALTKAQVESPPDPEHMVVKQVFYEQVQKSVALKNIVLSEDPQDGIIKLTAWTMMLYMGGFVHVTKTFHSDSQWCVD